MLITKSQHDTLEVAVYTCVVANLLITESERDTLKVAVSTPLVVLMCQQAEEEAWMLQADVLRSNHLCQDVQTGQVPALLPAQ